MKPRPLSLRLRFALWVILLLSAVLLVFSLFVYLRLSHNLRASLDDTLRVSGSGAIAAMDIEHGEIEWSDGFLDSIISSRAEKGFNLRLLSPEGNEWKTFGSLTRFPSSAKEEFQTVTDSNGDEYRVLSLPIVKNEKLIGTLQIAGSLEPIERTVRLLAVLLALCSPFLALIAGAGGYILAAGAVRPIERITKLARRITAQNLRERIDTSRLRDDEVGCLAETFNGMIERLEDSFQREQQFVADASHELRTPLAAMQTIIGITLERDRSAREYREAFIDLNDEVRRLRGLTEEMLVLIRNSKPREREDEAIDLTDLIEDVFQTMAPLAEGKGLSMSRSVETGLAVRGSRDSLIRLLVNLMDNAIKYTEAGSVAVSARSVPKGGVEIVVEDTGCGISLDQQPRVFDRFYRAEKSRTSSGSGLGLAIAKGIVESMSGTIRVESALGTGSRFIVELSR